MKEIIGNKRVTNAPLPNSIAKKHREIVDKKEIVEIFNRYIVNIGPNLAASTPESKMSFRTIFTTTVLASAPSVLKN